MAAIAPPVGQPQAAQMQPANNDALRRKAEEFEAVFLNVMLASAFEGLGDDDEFASQATDTWRGLQVEQFATAISKSGGIGIADRIYTELLQLQEQAQQ